MTPRRTFGLLLALAAVALTALAAGPASQPATDKPSGPVFKTSLGPLEIFPADNPWNTDISRSRVHPNSADYIRSIGPDKPLHPDFGTVWQGAPSGIPFVVVGGDQPKVPVSFEYADESDLGEPPAGTKAAKGVGWYPIPPDAPIEGGPKSAGDRHILVLDYPHKLLYELYSAYPQGKGYKAGSGAIFDLTSNKLRPAGWTSADAAGLPVFPGLVRHDEAEAGAIRHAIRFTVTRTQRAYIRPATHFASKSNDAKLPPMGLRVRLKADYDLSKAPKNCRVILQALKAYGMILADNGGDWFITGAPSPKWDDEELNWLKRVKGKDFEAVETGELVRG